MTAASFAFLDEEALRAEQARRNMHTFIQEAWSIVESKQFVDGWHIGAICEHLTAVKNGEILRLLINIPPRCMKSLNVCVLWQPWCWIEDPSSKWLFNSYAQSLSIRDSIKSRDVIESAWYQKHFVKGDWKLREDQNEKTRWQNTKHGYRLASSVGGTNTGEGADIIIVDDPHNTQKINSQAERQAALDWWDQTMSTRLNDEATGAYVVIMQRQHERDLTAHILESEQGYTHLCLPHEYEVDHPTPTISPVLGFKDPRTQEGEPLWPERFGQDIIDDLKKRMGRYGWAGQGQQRPTPKGGGLIDVSMIGVMDLGDLPEEWQADWRAWDMAGTDEDDNPKAAYTSGTRIRRYKLKGGISFYLVVHAEWFKKGPKDVEERIRNRAELDGHNTCITIEKEPGSGGKTTIEDYAVRVLDGFTFEKSDATGSKWERARGFMVAVEAGQVAMLRGEWNEKYLELLSRFGPGSAVNDIGDSSAHAFNMARREPEWVGIIKP